MQDFPDRHLHAVQRFAGARFGKSADADNPLWLKQLDDTAQVGITSGVKRRTLAGGRSEA